MIRLPISVRSIGLAVTAAVMVSSVDAAVEFMRLKDSKGRELYAKIVEVKGDKIVVERQKDRRKFELAYSQLSEISQMRVIDEVTEEFSKADAERLSNGGKLPDGFVPPPGEEIDGEGEAVDDTGLYRRFYPQTRDEIKETLKEIRGRKAPAGIGSGEFAAVTELNVFRFLCGVDYDAKATKTLNANALAASNACAAAGTIDHGLGSHTDKCNLSMGVGSMAATVRQYINDAGGNNREKRGHRMWCLHPKLDKTGFGKNGAYSAMWVMSSGGKDSRRSHAYPGKGFFPKEMVLGNAWSLYLKQGAPAKGELKVELYKLKDRPTKQFKWKEKIPGKEIKVQYVSTSGHWINFEPSSGPLNTSGIYFVRITGGGVKEQYLTELY